MTDHLETTSAAPPALVLASASPRRRELLASLGYRFAVVPSHAPEEVLPGETPQAHVQRPSETKAREVAARHDVPGRWFIGSDTVVVCDGEILGKPEGPDDASRMLTMLSGCSHQVFSGYAVFDRERGTIDSGSVVTGVTFRPLTGDEIAGYIASGEPLDKAGAYAIQGLAAAMVRGIDGSYSNVVGLPLCEVVEALERCGVPNPLTGKRHA